MKNFLAAIALSLILLSAPTHSFAMTETERITKIQELLALIVKLQAELALMAGTEQNESDEVVSDVVTVESKSVTATYRKYLATAYSREGKYQFIILVTANNKAVYIPKSVGMDDDENGFVLQVEGTSVPTTTSSLTVKQDTVTTITANQESYWKIEKGTTAEFKIIANVIGKKDEEYKVTLSEINYKTDLTRSRFSDTEINISTKFLEFE